LALGEVHLKLGHAPEACSIFEQGLEIAPKNEKLLGALVIASQLNHEVR
jgi:cytochrome c-type biogenesis protein CcmH/NrfG